jgi:hypothetical protein
VGDVTRPWDEQADRHVRRVPRVEDSVYRVSKRLRLQIAERVERRRKVGETDEQRIDAVDRCDVARVLNGRPALYLSNDCHLVVGGRDVLLELDAVPGCDFASATNSIFS